MTLQEQIIQKQSKKGFTLIELVIVIAIIAILAVIAIPVVVSIVNTSADTASNSTASAINEACHNFYALIKSGAIDNRTKNPDGSVISVAAAPNSSENARTTAARKATVADALKYSGINLPTKDSGGAPIYDGFYFYINDVSGHSAGSIECNPTDPLLVHELAPATKLHTLYKD